MRADLANLDHCAVPYLSSAAANLCWYNTSVYYISPILECLHGVFVIPFCLIRLKGVRK